MRSRITTTRHRSALNSLRWRLRTALALAVTEHAVVPIEPAAPPFRLISNLARDWESGATTSAGLIRRWFQKRPDVLIGTVRRGRKVVLGLRGGAVYDNPFSKVMRYFQPDPIIAMLDYNSPFQGKDLSSDSPPYDPANRPSLLLPDDWRDDRGIVDTGTFMLPVPVNPEDYLDFEGNGWTCVRRPQGSERRRGGDERIIPAYARFSRPLDGVVVHCGHSRVCVRAALPRVFHQGPLNEDIASMTERDFMQCLRSITSELLPATTDDARRQGHEWAATEMHLAVNFIGLVEQVIEAHRLSTTDRVRSPARVHGHDTIDWGSRDVGLKDQIYNRGLRSSQQEPRRRSESEKVTREAEARRRNLGRFESQLMSPERLAYLQDYLQQARPTDKAVLPIRLRDPSDGIIKVRRFRFDHTALHRFLMDEVGRFKRVGRMPGDGCRVKNSLAYVAVAQNPGIECMVTMNEKTRQDLRRGAAQVARQAYGCDLVAQCWRLRAHGSPT